MAVRILSHRFDVIMFQGGFPKCRKDAAPKVRSDLGVWGFVSHLPNHRTFACPARLIVASSGCFVARGCPF